jgi:hypothetical protein
MPGLIGLVGQGATADAASLSAYAIRHFEHYRSQHCSPFVNVQIAQVWRRDAEIAGSWHEDPGTGIRIFVNGTVLRASSPFRQITARDLLRPYLQGALIPDQYDGSFIIAIADPRSHTVTVYNDRLGTLPLYYASSAGLFGFAPEAKALFAMTGSTPEFSATGIVSFLTLGYCLADTTLFESIRFLEPGSRLVVRTDSASYTVDRYWRIEYSPDPVYRSRRRAEEALREAIIAGHRAVFSEPRERYYLLLSGGWDSRGMLAAANHLQRLPRRSLSWGLRDDIPLSDPYLAAKLAQQYDLDHHFISYDTDAFVENAMQWSYLTELNTDNFGWYGEGTNVLLNNYAGDADFILAGDECWGFGYHVRNRVEAMSSSHMPAPIPTAVAASLAPRVSRDCAEIYSAEIDKVLRGCGNQNPNDRKDFLYLHGRVARFIFSLGYYKEFAVEVRRPFLALQVLDVVRRVPVRFRYGKNLYISMLIRFFPELLAVPKRSADSLPRWRHDLQSKPVLSGYFRDLLSRQALANATFSEHLNLSAVDELVARFFASHYGGSKTEVDRSARSGRLVQSIKQRLTAYDDVRLALGLKKPASRRFADFDLLRRLALLSLLDQQLPRFRRGA